MTDHHEDFSAHLLDAATGVLARFPAELRPEIYALSFRIWRTDDDDRRPYVAIGCNTESRYERESLRTDPGEARWNYAYWRLDGFETLGNVPGDPVGSRLYTTEVRRLGLWFEDDGSEDEAPENGGQGNGAPDDDRESRRELLREHFASACVRVARRLHTEGRIERIFGRPLPVVVFDMYCPGWEVEATRAANPPEAVRDFLAWYDTPAPG
ncbi:hypothetical protein ABZ714_17000 [Streptomyces sp. NPDC006798]|uniref:hypothetical protein n=1 Tax=Streptomyces sp. NPDC006798 TaxID=3155462 RepID=UPI0033E87CDA